MYFFSSDSAMSSHRRTFSKRVEAQFFGRNQELVPTLVGK